MPPSKKSPLSDANAVRSEAPEPEVTLDLGSSEPPQPPPPVPPVEPEAPAAPPSDEGVQVLTSAEMPRTPRYRILNEKKLSWRANLIHFRVGEEFDASTHSPEALAAFQEAGLELEQIE